MAKPCGITSERNRKVWFGPWRLDRHRLTRKVRDEAVNSIYIAILPEI